jgi:hypothetical protein
MRKITLALALSLTFAMTVMLNATTVQLETGHWPIDCARSVEIDDFDYIYELKNVPLDGRFIELKDGSLWQLESLGYESTSFYRQYKDVLEIGFIEELVDLWQPGELLIFHKITNREIDSRDVLLIYNLDRDLLIDVTSVSPPKYHCLTISEIDTQNNLILLSDSSIWHYSQWDNGIVDTWFPGNPILVAKDTPWRSSHTHALVNLEYCDCASTLGHIHRNRVSVISYE